jgi:outer membrane protein
MLKIIKTSFCCLLTLAACPALSDTLSDITEVYTAEGVPGQTEEASSGFHGSLGAGLINYKKNISDSSRKTALLPLVTLTYEDWAHWNIGGGGVWLLQSEDRSARLGVGIKGRRGYTASDDPAYVGMSERKNSIDVGVNARWKTSAVNTSVNYYTDLGNASKGSSATLRFSHVFRLNQEFSLIPSVSAEWMSARVVDYYYGVSASEATTNRPAYSGRSTVNLGAGLTAGYRIDRSWSLLGGLNYTKLGSGIVDSPLVQHSNSDFVYFGANWMF